jgi:sodium/proline symporter
MSHSYRLAKVGTLVVTAIVLAIALTNNESVFSLIIFAWSILASGLGVLLVLRSWQKPVSTPCAIIMMLVGVAVAVIWRQAGLSGNLYEVLPGMASGVLVYAIFRLVEPKSVTSH